MSSRFDTAFTLVCVTVGALPAYSIASADPGGAALAALLIAWLLCGFKTNRKGEHDAH